MLKIPSTILDLGVKTLLVLTSLSVFCAMDLGVIQDSSRKHEHERSYPFQSITEQPLYALHYVSLDMGNTLLSGVTQAQLRRLHRVPNFAA